MKVPGLRNGYIRGHVGKTKVYSLWYRNSENAFAVLSSFLLEVTNTANTSLVQASSRKKTRGADVIFSQSQTSTGKTGVYVCVSYPLVF